MSTSTFCDRTRIPHQTRGRRPGLNSKERLQNEVRLAQELLDSRHAGLRTIASQVLGECPPDPEGIERLRNMRKDLEKARETLVDATCRLHYSIFRSSHDRL